MLVNFLKYVPAINIASREYSHSCPTFQWLSYSLLASVNTFFVFLRTVPARKNTQLFQIDEEYNFSFQNPKET